MQKTFETFGNYILLEKLASGGMAEVYLAKKIAASGVQKFVAVKRILSQFSDSQDFIDMFKDEAKIAINLSHSNVVSIYDFGTEKGQFYIVMEFVEGRNLRQILNRMKRVDKYFSVAQVVHIIKQVAAGLDHAHRCIDPTTGRPLNIIHRDMSPQNVMLGFEGDAKIVDFGIAKAAHQLEATRAGTLKGKFGYMSPEQVEGQAVDSRTDIFALGIMVWEMLAGQRLFLANSEINTLRKIRECDVPSLRKINPNIPAELDQIVQKALEKEKKDRYQSAGDLARDLQGFLSRFDPDFSAQDLSIFVKSLFSEEIIQIRKKQIVYAQVTAHDPQINESTQVLNTRNTVIDQEDMSLDGISFDSLHSTVAQELTEEDAEMPTQLKKASGIDFAGTNYEDNETKRKRLQIAKRSAHRKAAEYRNTTYTDTTNSVLAIKQEENSRNATIFTLLFSMSFILVFFAFINKFHPSFKVNFCKAVEPYGICPRSLYVAPNFLTVSSTPSDAIVYLNDKKVGNTPYDLHVQKLPLKIDVIKGGFKKETRVLHTIPETNSMNIVLSDVPSGWLVIKAVGVEIYVDGVKVKSGQKFAVPADKQVVVKVVNPVTGATHQEVHRAAKNQVKRIFIDPPSR